MSRQTRKPSAEAPALPTSLGPKITMPRKGNKAAAKAIAKGDTLWDKRKVERAARKQAQAQSRLSTKAHRLTRRQKQWLLGHLPGWYFNSANSTLVVPLDGDIVKHMDDLGKALTLPYMKAAMLRVQGFSLEQLRILATAAPVTLVLSHMDSQTDTITRARPYRKAESSNG